MYLLIPELMISFDACKNCGGYIEAFFLARLFPSTSQIFAAFLLCPLQEDSLMSSTQKHFP